MNHIGWETEQFQRHRSHLAAVAYRMLGSVSEAEDALQEAWLRLSRSQQETIHNARAWLTTIVGRVCIDMLRARQSRREDYVGAWVPEPIVEIDEQADPEQQMLIADAVGLALLVVIGTTDTDYDGPLDHVTASDDDIDYLLEVANFTIPDAALDRTHIVATWAGLRPLIQPEGSMAASSVSREQQIVTSPHGLLTIAGGKLTTSRVMGRQVIDAAIDLLGTNFGLRGVPSSRSASVPISGGDPGELFLAHTRLAELAVAHGVRDRWRVYGGNGRALADIAQADPAAAQDLGVKHLTLAEVRYAIQEEIALTITDFFARRASVFYWTDDGGLSVADAVADEMARLLGWSAEQRGEPRRTARRIPRMGRRKPVRPRPRLMPATFGRRMARVSALSRTKSPTGGRRKTRTRPDESGSVRAQGLSRISLPVGWFSAGVTSIVSPGLRIVVGTSRSAAAAAKRSVASGTGW